MFVMMKNILLIMIVLLSIPMNALAFTNSTIICLDNNTLQENITVIVGANETTVSLTEYCSNGCDNNTFSCSPLEWEASVFNMALFIIVIIGMVMVWKFARSRS